MSASPHGVLAIARDVVARPEMGLNGVWPRAAAHLCRQALELALEEFWKRRMPALAEAPMRAQLVCLPHYMKDEELARSVGYTWSALSHACHHHMYELAPAVSELKAWADTVEALIAELGTDSNELKSASPPSPPTRNLRAKNHGNSW